MKKFSFKQNALKLLALLLLGFNLSFIWVFLPVFAQSGTTNILISEADKNLYSNLSSMENYYYGHDYDNEVLGKRLSRLETTILKYKKSSLDLNKRYKDLFTQYQRIRSPFQTVNQYDDTLSNTQTQLLRLMERRIFNKENNYLPFRDRISKIELAVFGDIKEGNIQERFDYISRNTPIQIKGIRVSNNSRTLASFKPGYEKIEETPVIEQKTFSALDIGYDHSVGDYFHMIATNDNGEILRWKDFPLFVFINTNNRVEKEASQKAIGLWSTTFPIYETDTPDVANILIDFASKGQFITVPIIEKNSDSTTLKILINMKGINNIPTYDLLVHYIAHQMGHSLGIWGHSNNPADIMFPMGILGLRDINVRISNDYFYTPLPMPSKVPNITQRDLNTLYKIYQQPTSIVRIIQSK